MFLEVYPQVLGVSTLKYCPKCENVYPATAEYFHLNSRSKDGFAFRCKACAKQATRDWNAANPDRVKANSRRWREANPELAKANNKTWHEANRDRLLPKYRAASRAWYQANKERRHETAQEWRKANPDRRRAKNREWVLANPDRVKEYRDRYMEKNPDKERERSQRRRVRKANAPGSLLVGGSHKVARSSPSRPKIPNTSACASAPLMWLSAPQLYSVIANLVPG